MFHIPAHKNLDHPAGQVIPADRPDQPEPVKMNLWEAWFSAVIIPVAVFAIVIYGVLQ